MSWLSSFANDVGSFVQNDIVKPVENVGTDIANVWNEQPTWAKGLEIGAGATLATAGVADLFAPELFAGGAAVDAGSALSFADTAATGAVDTTGLPAEITAGASSDLDAASASGSSALYQSLDSAAAAPGSSASGATGFSWDSILKGTENSLAKNFPGIALSAGGLGLSFLEGKKNDANANVLAAQAPALAQEGASLSAQGTQLTQYLTNGTLPPGQQAQVTQAVQAEKARIIANAAANGQNTNPTQNSALAQDLSAADQNGIALAGKLEQNLAAAGTQLLQTGLTETGLSTQLYETLYKMDEANNTQLMQSIASLAAAFGGGTKIGTGATGTISFNS